MLYSKLIITHFSNILGINRFTFDLNQGSIELVLTNILQTENTSLDCTRFILLSEQALTNNIPPVPQLRLSRCASSSVDSTNIITLVLLDQDVDAVKLDTTIATAISHTFLSVETGNGIIDSNNGAELSAISLQDATQADVYIVSASFKQWCHQMSRIFNPSLI